MKQIAITSNAHDQHVMLSIALFAAYVPWVLYRPTLGGCSSDHVLHGAIRIALVGLWLAYLLLVRARIGTFKWKNFGIGALAGGGWLALLMTIRELSDHRPIYDHLLHRLHYQHIISLAPTVTISGLYAAHSGRIRGAAISGFVVLTLQFVAVELATLPLLCVY